MNTTALYELVKSCSLQIRKGAELYANGEPTHMETDENGNPRIAGLDKPGLNVGEIWAMPAESDIKPEYRDSEDFKKIDVHFMLIGVDMKKALPAKEEFVQLMEEYPDRKELAGGPSYIAMGYRLGDQGFALQVMAVGAALGLWDVMTPEKLHITGPQADQLAGAGFVMITGLPITPAHANN